MTKFCAVCGSPVQPGTAFCGGCGKPLPGAAAPPGPQPPFVPPPPPPPSYGAPLPAHPRPAPSFAPPPPPAYGAPPPVAPPPPAYSAPPPYQAAPPYQPPPQPGYYAPPAAPLNLSPGEGGLPPSPRPWDFQVSAAGVGDNLARSMNLVGMPGMPMGWLEMMVRGAFLDGRVYRQAALDVNGNGGAILALVTPVVASVIGSSLLSFGSMRFLGGYFAFTMVVSAVIGVFSMVAALGAMSALSQSITGWKLGFGQILRALAYAQSPGVLGIIPIIGGLLGGLWRIPTTLAAIREISGGDTGKAAILLLIGGVASVVLAMVLSPLLLAGFVLFR